MIPEKIKNNMKELDCVEVTAEREEYAKEGVHRGMQGWICDAYSKNASWLVNFPQCGEKPDIATLVVKACDLKCIPVMNASLNEEIKVQFENRSHETKDRS